MRTRALQPSSEAAQELKLLTEDSQRQVRHQTRLVCLDHYLILNEAHLRRLLRGYIAYYNTARPHQSLDHNSPQPREVHPPELGRVVSIPQVGGLHHLYQRAA
jgi:hypothetical protein